MTTMIEVDDLVEVYPDGEKAVDGVSFKVDEGEFFGFLGPNGAGKSTTIKVLTTLLEKTSGSIRISGYDLDKDSKSIRKIIGVQFQETTVDRDLTGRQNLQLQGNLQRMKSRALERRIDDLLALVGLSDVADKKVAYYSAGMSKRLDLACTLVHSPKLLFLDEPTVGLDPQSRAMVWKLLQGLNSSGVTIFLTTQYMEEADKLCNRISIIDHGRIVVAGSPTELKRMVEGDRITVEVENGNGGLTSDACEKIAGSVEGVVKVLPKDNFLLLYADDGSKTVPKIVRALDDMGISMASVSVSSPSLDDVFLQRTGKTIRQETPSKVKKGHRRPVH